MPWVSTESSRNPRNRRSTESSHGIVVGAGSRPAGAEGDGNQPERSWAFAESWLSNGGGP
jgi:hypothetical protein